MSKKIVSIEIELKDYEPIKFKMDEAKELYEQLDAIFGEKVVHHYDPIRSIDWWHRPYYTWYNANGTSNVGTGNPPNTDTITISGSTAADLVNCKAVSSTTGMQVSYLSS